MSTLFTILLIASGFLIWYFSKKQKNNKNRNISIVAFIICFVLVGVTAPKNDSDALNSSAKSENVSEKKKVYKYTNDEAKGFAAYFKENAEIIDSGEKVDFSVGADKSYVSARVGESWKSESISRKIYLSNELLKEKNRLFKEWLASKDDSLDSEDYLPGLIVTISDADNTIISQEYSDEMKIIND